jgi:hypothetical protein
MTGWRRASVRQAHKSGPAPVGNAETATFGRRKITTMNCIGGLSIAQSVSESAAKYFLSVELPARRIRTVAPLHRRPKNLPSALVWVKSAFDSQSCHRFGSMQ